MNLEGVPLKRSLTLLLDQLGLAYEVEDGLLTISAAGDGDRGPAGAADERSRQIREALARKVVMPFPDRTPLEMVIKYVRVATRGPGLPDGIPIHVDIADRIQRRSVIAGKFAQQLAFQIESRLLQRLRRHRSGRRGHIAWLVADNACKLRQRIIVRQKTDIGGLASR